MSNWIEEIENFIGQGKTKEALTTLMNKAGYWGDFRSRIIMLQGRLSRLEKANQAGKEKDYDNKLSEIESSILNLLVEIQNSSFYKKQTQGTNSNPIVNQPNKSVTFNDKNEGKSTLKELQDAVTLLQQKKINHNTTEDELREIQDLIEKLHKGVFGGLEDAILNTSQARASQAGICFDKIFVNQKLSQNKPLVQKIATIRGEKEKYKWYDRSLIVSALTLSLINHKLDVKKLNLLIDFLTDSEEKVWERALVGLVLVLIRFKQRIKGLRNIKRRLEGLRDSRKIQEALKVIDLILLHKLYKQNTFNPKVYQHPFFSKNPRNCFLPFYEENPVWKDALENQTMKKLILIISRSI